MIFFWKLQHEQVLAYKTEQHLNKQFYMARIINMEILRNIEVISDTLHVVEFCIDGNDAQYGKPIFIIIIVLFVSTSQNSTDIDHCTVSLSLTYILLRK